MCRPHHRLLTPWNDHRIALKKPVGESERELEEETEVEVVVVVKKKKKKVLDSKKAVKNEKWLRWRMGLVKLVQQQWKKRKECVT